jgi:hypothetical protein
VLPTPIYWPADWREESVKIEAFAVMTSGKNVRVYFV